MSICFDNSLSEIDSNNIQSLRKTMDLEPFVMNKRKYRQWIVIVSKLIAGSETVASVN